MGVICPLIFPPRRLYRTPASAILIEQPYYGRNPFINFVGRVPYDGRSCERLQLQIFTKLHLRKILTLSILNPRRHQGNGRSGKFTP
jgi:hypothetical protein